MAISKAKLVDIINKHNDPDDPTHIFNIQCSSATNLFTGRFVGNIVIDGDDLVFNEVDNTEEEVYTIRTGLENIDIVQYKSDPTMSALYLKIHKLLAEVSALPYLSTDPAVSAKVTPLKKIKITDAVAGSKTAYEAAVTAVTTIKDKRAELQQVADQAWAIKNRFIEVLHASALNHLDVSYLFTEMRELEAEIYSSTSTRLTSALKTEMERALKKYQDYGEILDKFLVAEISAAEADKEKVDKFWTAIRSGATIENIF